MTNARNLTNVRAMPDGAYLCDVELYDEWTGVWEKVPYAACAGDPAPVNRWILDEIATGNYPVTEWTPPPAPPVEQPAPSEGPAVL